MGFHDAATMLAYQQRQQAMRTGPANTGGVGNFFNMPINMDTARQALAIHPAMMYQSILDKLNSVM
jgi:hypothetical protein